MALFLIDKLRQRKTGNIIYPITKAQAVYMPDDETTLDVELNNIKNDIATIESTSTASKAYSAGEFLVHGSQLYKVTASIAAGDAITVGVNIESTSVGDELSELNSKTENIVRFLASWDYTLSANGNANTNGKTIIDSLTPSGYKVIGVIGFTTNNVQVVPISAHYGNSDYSFQVRNLSSSQQTGTLRVYVIASRIPVLVI